MNVILSLLLLSLSLCIYIYIYIYGCIAAREITKKNCPCITHGFVVVGIHAYSIYIIYACVAFSAPYTYFGVSTVLLVS